LRSLISLILFALSCLPSLVSAGPKALVIVDMQDNFVTRGRSDKLPENQETLRILDIKQNEMIDVAKRRGLPIMLVEYVGNGPTNEKIMARIGNYAKVFTILKSTDGLYDWFNTSAEVAREGLKEFGVTDLIIMGANGGSCVERTIRGALRAGYRVWAYKNGIADFNPITFQYPYSYGDQYAYSDLPGMGLKEFNEPVQAVNLRRMPRSGN
jgi:nicotinamidase-related amidase